MRTKRVRQSVLILALWLLCAFWMQPVALAQEGKLTWGQITSPALASNLIGDPETKSFAIYLPPSYETSAKRYPVIYVLHGYTQDAGGLTGIKPTIDFMIRNQDIGEMIAVFVNGSNKFLGSFYSSSKTIGDYETYITKDLVNHIDANYRTIPHRNSRGITGHSMGGYGSMHLALKYPSVFSVVVAQAGTYDFDTERRKDIIKAIAFAEPKDWGEFSQLFWRTQSAFAMSAAMSSNPAKPPFFLDKPFELVDGKAEIVPEIWKRIVEADIIHGHLERYLKQPVRLNGIKIVHGTSDDVTPVSEAQAADKAMTDLGINHVYEEHGGGHVFIAEKSLKFMSDNLAFKLLPATSVQPRGKLATTCGEVKRGR